MKTLLVSINAKYIHSNLAVRYLREYVKGLFPNTEIAEFNINQPLQLIRSQIVDAKPDVLGISCYIWNWDMVQKLVSDIKSVLPAVTIVLGGPEVSYDVQEHLIRSPAVDFIIRGEGEEPLRQLLTKLAADQAPEQWAHTVPGVVYKGTDDRARVEPYQMDLGQLASPYGGSLDQLESKVLYYEASRGCPYRCSFCLSSLSGVVRFVPLERVFRDLERLLNLQPKQIRFVDRTFNAHPERALTLVRWMAKQATKTRFQLEITGDALRDELVDAFLEAPPHRFQLEIGVQSTSEQALTGVQRRSDLQRLYRTVTTLRQGKTPIRVMLDLIAGLPHESLETFGRSFDAVYNLQPTKIHLGFLKFLRGSQLREEAGHLGYVFQEHPPYEILASPWLDVEDLQHLHVVEDLVERYYNSGRFQYSLPWLIAANGGSPFRFYSHLARWWRQHRLHLRGHSSVQLYPLLLDYADFVPKKQLQGRLGVDFRVNHRTQPLPVELELEDASNEVQRWLDSSTLDQKFPQFQGLSARQIRKRLHSLRLPHAIIETADANVDDSAVGGQIVLFHYRDLQVPAEVLPLAPSRNFVVD